MFQDLDLTLKTLLSTRLPTGLVDQNNGISFGTPDSATLSLPSINLFLFWIVENMELRRAGGPVQRMTSGRAMSTVEPMRIDCHYMVSAWSQGGDDETKTHNEHMLLGAALTVLRAYPEIPMELLQGTLASSQQYPLRAFMLRPDSQQARGDFWQALGGKPKATFTYIVTVSLPWSDLVDVGGLVTQMGA